MNGNGNEKRLEGYRRLIDIARDLASTLDLDVLLKRIVCASAELTEAEAASILLYDEAAGQLYFQVTTNLDQPTLRGLAVPLEGSVAGWIVTNRQAARIPDVKIDPRHFGIEKQTHITTCSLLGVPLVTKDKVVGVLEVINKHAGEFTCDDEDLLNVLGAQAAVAIENTRLFHQSDLVAEFVHELRTPLASIGTATYLLLRPEMSQEQRQSIILNIHNETLRLNTMAASFLDLARLESGRVQFSLTCFDLPPLLDECIEIMQSKADEIHVTLEHQVPADFPQVEADRNKIKQVVLNLLSNAIKYNCTNGSVIISAGLEKNNWSLSVRDSGMGIPAKSLPHLFEKFYRVDKSEGKVPGTGLGLSICRQIVSGHGGTIDVKSKYGKGATFTVRIPR
jgi:signal transduction histidine kinase